jgi:hypothetical protein
MSDEEVELVDPQNTLKEACQPGCGRFKEFLENCTKRVAGTITRALFFFLSGAPVLSPTLCRTLHA